MALSEDHKVMVEVYRRVPDLPRSFDAVAIGKIRVIFSLEAEGLVVADFIANERFGLRVTMAQSPGGGATEADAITALIAAVIENHAEIRDALAESP